MSDPFNTFDEASESPFVTTEAPSVPDSNESVVEAPPAEPLPEPGEAAIETPPTPEEAPTEETPTEEAPEPAKDEPEAPKEEQSLEEAEKEAETRLADPKSPRWYKNAVENVYKPKIETLSKELETYAQYGTKEEIAAKIELLNSLDSVRSNPSTGMPERSTEDFVKGIYEKDPQTAYQLINDLSTLPSPTTPGYTVLQEMFKQVGIDPARLDEVKTFAANGYQLQQGQYPPPAAEELALIPEHLQATFSALSPDRRDDMLLASEHVRNEALEEAKLAREVKQREELAAQSSTQKEAAEKAERDAAFARQVDTKASEHFTKTSEAVFTTFVESLAKQAGMTNMDSLMIANTVLNSFEPTLAGKQSQDMLKAEGIEVDPQIAATIGQLQENARHIAYYEAVQDQPSYEKAVAKQVELQERLSAKGNKIIASLALKRAKTVTPPPSAPTTRHATAGVGTTVGSTNNGSFDFSDESYRSALRASGFGQKQ